MERKAFNFYKSYYDVVIELPETDKLPFLMAIIKMQFEGVEPDNLSGIAKIAFLGQKHSIIKQIEGFKAGKKTDNKKHPAKHPDRVPDSDPANKNKDKNKNKGNKPKPIKIPFEQSEIFDKIKFAETFNEWNKLKLKHYYESAHRYSLEGNKYVRWDLAIRDWERKDSLKGFVIKEDSQETETEYKRRVWQERNGGSQ